MTTIPYDSDAIRAAITAAAQAIAAHAEQEGIVLTPEQCEDLAATVISHYLAFTAGVRYASGPAGAELAQPSTARAPSSAKLDQ